MFDKVGLHSCPYCNNQIWWKSQDDFNNNWRSYSVLRGFCPNCFADYQIFRVQSADYQVEAHTLDEYMVTLNSPSLGNIHYREKTMSVEERKGFIELVKLLRGASPKAQAVNQLALVWAVWAGGNPSLSGLPVQQTLLQQQNKQTLLTYLKVGYNRYPYHISNVLIKLNLADWLAEIGVICSRCQLGIPADRQNNCPFCGGKSEEQAAQSPLEILKIRYAKGEITKEQYEEMRKTLET